MKAVLVCVKEKGPGRGWWGPPKGTHGAQDTPSGGVAPVGEDKTTNHMMTLFNDAAGVNVIDGYYPDTALARVKKETCEALQQKLIEDHSDLFNDEDAAYTASNYVLRNWADDSNTGGSSMTQIAASQEFGVGLSPWQDRKFELQLVRLDQEKSWNEEVHRSLTPEVTKRRAILSAMYNHTQETLTKEGFGPNDTIRVRRGISRRASDASGIRLGSTVTLTERNALESWAVDLETAKMFAEGGDYRGGMGIVFEMDVPVKSILSIPTTGIGCLGESEVVVIGRPGATAKVVDVIMGG
jgi:hypothetical protein